MSTIYEPLFSPPPLSPPTGLTAVGTSGGIFVTLVHDTTPTVRFTIVELTDTLDDYSEAITAIIPLQETGVLVAGLLGSTQYYIRAKCIDVWGNESAYDDTTGITETTLAVASGSGGGGVGPPGMDGHPGADAFWYPPAKGPQGATGSTGASGSNGTNGTNSISDVGTFNIVLGDGSTALTTGFAGYFEVPYKCDLNTWTLLADAGTCTIDLWSDTYANFPPVVGDAMTTGGTKPNISASAKGQGSPTSWTKTGFAAGDILGVNIDAVATATRITLSLKVTKTV